VQMPTFCAILAISIRHPTGQTMTSQAAVIHMELELHKETEPSSTAHVSGRRPHTDDTAAEQTALRGGADK